MKKYMYRPTDLVIPNTRWWNRHRMWPIPWKLGKREKYLHNALKA